MTDTKDRNRCSLLEGTAAAMGLAIECGTRSSARGEPIDTGPLIALGREEPFIRLSS